MNTKRITEPLHMTIDYIPNDYFDDGDDWELHISVNEDNSGQHNLVPFTERLPDLTVEDVLNSIEEAINDELFDNDEIRPQYESKESVLTNAKKVAARKAFSKLISAIIEYAKKEQTDVIKGVTVFDMINDITNDLESFL